MTCRPKGFARRATARATLPNEIRPRVWPHSRGTSLSKGRPWNQSPRRTMESISRIRRAPARSNAIVWSATSSMNTSGTLVTTMPASVAASTSTMSTPTLPTPITMHSSRPAITERLMRKPQEVMMASASEASARNSSSDVAATSTSSATGRSASSSKV